SFAAFWLHNNKGRLTRGCNPAYSKSIHTWLRFGEIMRGSLSVLRLRSLTPVTYLCKLLGIHSLVAFLQLELFRV
ncbi:hypothetical protein JZM00_23040, partial [Escherichia coli]|nr:hypothetical protein [Escherichia coli]MBN6229916.1 hypothetical protein [Escherichia coli]